MNKNIILVGGTGRCGTTILNQALSLNEKCVVSPPLRFMIDPDGVLPFVSNAHKYTPYSSNLAYKRLKRLLYRVNKPAIFHTYISKLKKLQNNLDINLVPPYAHLNAGSFCPQYIDLVKKLLIDIIDVSYEGRWVGTELVESNTIFCASQDSEELFNYVAEFYHGYVNSSMWCNKEAITFVDRNTWNHLWINEFHRFNNRIKLLHIYRDPRDVIASFSDQLWMPSNHIDSARVYQSLMNRWFQIRSTLNHASFFEISLEELVNNKEEMLRSICEFCNTPWSDKMIEINLEKSNSGRWKQDMHKKNYKEIEKIIKPSLIEYGYD